MKIINKLIALVIVAFLSFSACSDFDEMNIDPTRLTQANPGTLLNPILYQMSTYNWNRYNGFTFPLMQGTVSTSSVSGLGWYYIKDSEGDGTWTTYYKWLSNIREMEKQAITLNEPNYRAVALTLRAWIFQLLVDAWGDVPMTEACRGDEGLFTPKFDKQLDIYKQIIADLDSANAIFNTAVGLKYNTSSELLYNTDASVTGGVSTGIVKWKKFANSLKLRVLLRVLDVPGLNAKTKLEELLDSPEKYPIFASNADAALLAISGVYPQEAPLTRPQDFTSYTYYSEFFIDNLKNWNDPRLEKIASKPGGVFSGFPSGYDVTPSGNASQPLQAIAIAPMKLTLMSFAEVELILAELAQRSVTDDDAETHYKNGVKASVEQWNATMPADYFDNPLTAYNGSLEQLMTQKYYALFFCDYQAWFEYNRTGFPRVPKGVGVPAANYMPRRFKYPLVLQRTNLKNYQDAKTSMGGSDNFDVKLIWQP